MASIADRASTITHRIAEETRDTALVVLKSVIKHDVITETAGEAIVV